MKQSRQPVDYAVIGLGAALALFVVGASVVLAVRGDAPTAFWSAGGAIAGGLLGVIAQSPANPQSPKRAAASHSADRIHDAAVRAATEAGAQVSPQQRLTAVEILEAVRERGRNSLAENKAVASKQATVAGVARQSADDAVKIHADALSVAQQELSAADARIRPGTEKQSGAQSAEAAKATAAVSSTKAKVAVLQAAAKGAASAEATAVDHSIIAAGSVDTTHSSGPSRTTVGTLLVIFVLLLATGVVFASGVVVPPGNFGNRPLDNLIKTVVALASAAGTGLIGLFAPTQSNASSKQ
jgi:hypothetical protein